VKGRGKIGRPATAGLWFFDGLAEHLESGFIALSF